MFQKLHHVAYRCRDAQETLDLYTKVLGLKYAASEISPEGAKPYGEEVDLIHIILRMRRWQLHRVLRSPQPAPCAARSEYAIPGQSHRVRGAELEALLAGKRRLETAGVDVLGPKDHSFCQSIYFFDPNGIRLEMTARTEAPGELDRMGRAAAGQLVAWNERKRRKYGVPPH